MATLVSLRLADLGWVVVAQGMGFGLQQLTSNLSSGLSLLMEGKLKVGDLIEFGQTTGFIPEISIRTPVIHTSRGAETVVPASAITNAPVKNLSSLSPDGRVDVEVSVAHGSDPLAVTEVLLDAALADPPPKVLLSPNRQVER